MKDENLENSVITLHAKGWPIRRISQVTSTVEYMKRPWIRE